LCDFSKRNGLSARNDRPMDALQAKRVGPYRRQQIKGSFLLAEGPMIALMIGRGVLRRCSDVGHSKGVGSGINPQAGGASWSS
jgi:hypothetical protein